MCKLFTNCLDQLISIILGYNFRLVSTDALARGMDLPNVHCVISYSAPKHLKTYIHRVGRTARAGEYGLAITMLNKSQLFKFRAMLNQAEKNNVEEVFIF